MSFRRLGLRTIAVLLAVLIPPVAGGCRGILNDDLFSSFGGNAVTGLSRPNGAIVILVMNLTNSAAVVRIRVTKDTGGAVDLSVPLDPFGPQTELDHATLVQECDVARIEFLGGSIQSDTGGDPVEIPAELPPVLYGLNLFCGRVVVITIPGIGLPPVMSVY